MTIPSRSGFRPIGSGLHALAFVAASLMLAAAPAHADEDCFARAGAYQGVNPLILRAIAWYESKGNGHQLLLSIIPAAFKGYS